MCSGRIESIVSHGKGYCWNISGATARPEEEEEEEEMMTQLPSRYNF